MHEPVLCTNRALKVVTLLLVGSPYKTLMLTAASVQALAGLAGCI